MDDNSSKEGIIWKKDEQKKLTVHPNNQIPEKGMKKERREFIPKKNSSRKG
ncbi:hypothetical protein [Butyrivibrio sp. JL13D10]|uniref:hypothetical protein n=1 Tax=Butyrivibrio sp. JL13D10 TaxID=3236815 RepID=UPI0038B68281